MTVTNPLGKTTTYAYNALGLVTEESGDAAYKVTYDYDEYGAKNKMWTWRDASTSDLTEWIYQPGTGLLLEKKDSSGKSVIHTYTSTGKSATRTWARGVSTIYSYDPVIGDLNGIDYSDSTPDVTLGDYDRLGRPTTITQVGIGSETLTYHPGQTASNARYYDAGHSLLPGKGIRRLQPYVLGEEYGFRETSGSDTSVLRTVAYYYSGLTGLLDTITDGNETYTYAYHPNSALVSTILSNSFTTAWFRENRYYDTGGRLLGIRSDRMNGSTVVAPISAYAYDYDELGRRVKQTFLDGSKWEYGYNDRSEVTSAIRKTSGGTEITPLNAAYSYDGIGNRLTSSSAVLGDHTYTPNGLNQYASITSTDTRTAVGRAPSSWNVQVAGVTASRIDEVFYRPLTASNASAPVWQNVVVQRDTGSPTTTQHFWYAPQSVSPTHDFDGNLTNDGRWTYLWDAENRLVQMETTTQATAAGHPYTKLQFAYDWQGRRIARHVWQGGTQASPTFKSSHRWLYDGWNVITEFTAPSAASTTLTRLNTFTWGLDLSGTLQGAGGVGGLLVQTAVSGGVTERASCDGNGNIVAWTKSNASAPTSRREYDAFGNTLVSEGAAPSTFGFSTKMQDTETGLYYYGYRFYDPVTGRWPSRDPIEEEGGVNLYGFVGNDGISNIDDLGRFIGSKEDVDGVGDDFTKYQKLPENDMNWMSEEISGWIAAQGFLGHTDFANQATKCKKKGRHHDRETDFDYRAEDDVAEWRAAPGTSDEAHQHHFQTVEVSESQLETASTACDVSEFERAMHRLQDFDSHVAKKFEWKHGHLGGYAHRKKPHRNPEGYTRHGEWWISPDLDHAAWRSANERTKKWLAIWNKRCCCQKVGSSPRKLWFDKPIYGWVRRN